MNLDKILEEHKKWLDGDGGARADLHDADLRYEDLHDADLRWTDLSGADIDFASWPLWCGSIGVKIDKRIARQLLYHAVAVSVGVLSDECFSEALLKEVNKFHRVKSGDVEKITLEGTK